MIIPSEVKKCVVFVCRPIQTQHGEAWEAIGTGFLVGFPAQDVEGHHTYLVTAKHLTVKLGTERIAARVNNKQGGITHLLGENVTWYDHPDHENNPADLSVTHIGTVDAYDAKTIPISMFLSEEALASEQVGVGDEVFFTGLFSHLAGAKKNLPIVRVGNLAMIPEQKVPLKMFGDMEAYLIEARSLGGISGSPVFVRQTVPLGVSPFYLLGIMHGHWDIPVNIEDIIPNNDDTEDGVGARGVNMGIAIVTPVKKILETLMRPDLQKKRNEVEQRHLKANTKIQ